jgi:hypothetical protein
MGLERVRVALVRGLISREVQCAKTLWIGSKSKKIGANAVTAS